MGTVSQTTMGRVGRVSVLCVIVAVVVFLAQHGQCTSTCSPEGAACGLIRVTRKPRVLLAEEGRRVVTEEEDSRSFKMSRSLNVTCCEGLECVDKADASGDMWCARSTVQLLRDILM